MAALRETNFLYLLIGLLIVLFAGPISVEFTDQAPGLIIQVTFSATLIIGIWSLIESRLLFRLGLSLAISEFVATIINYVWPSMFMDQLTLVLAMAFCGLSLVFALRHLFSRGRIDGNSVVGAICIYLLLGISLSIMNLLIYRQLPGSFAGLSTGENANQGLDLIYYSFVTMTTLGFGDIVPVGPLARAIAYLGAITGQFYIAILVGLVVGMYLSEKRSADQSKP